MKILKGVKGGVLSTLGKAADLGKDAAKTTVRAAGDAAASEITAKVIKVGVDIAVDTSLGTVDRAVHKLGIVAEVLPSKSLKDAHEIVSGTIGTIREKVTDVATKNIQNIAQSSGEKLIKAGSKDPTQ
jgi:spore coat polysaccharide biosynthesis protein SpsF (cytidylyltransferase family)